MPKQVGRKQRPNVFVALLRGVNVGGNSMVNMRALKQSFEANGFTRVSTYINSGNVIFTTKQTDPRKLEQRVEQILLQEFRLDSKVVVRSLRELEQLVQSLPASWTSDSNWRYNVMFLRHTVDSENILTELIPKSDREQVAYRPGTVLWWAQVTELNQTMMGKLSSRKIFQEMTVRNLNTTKKLYELMKQTESSS